jgi:nitrate reductase delta subunit
MGSNAILAEAFRYPSPDRLEQLEYWTLDLPPGPVKNSLASFLGKALELTLGEWEELYTRTWDLNPLAVPYIGFQLWGEDYRRGNFMARLQAAYREAGVELDGELPDHLVPVLQYLDRANEPLPELLEALPQAVEKMAAALKKSEPENPYLILIESVGNATPVGARRGS